MSTLNTHRSSHRRGSTKKGVLRYFAKFKGKHLCPRPAALSKKTPWHRCFSCEFCETFKNIFFYRTPPDVLLLTLLIPYPGLLETLEKMGW